MRGQHYWIQFGAISGAVAVGTFIAIVVSDVATLKSAACDARPACLRDWVGALSGWVAALGAFLAAIITLPELKRQASEARRQTDFAVGDAEPDFVLQRNVPKKRLALEVTNLNRRAILIESWEPDGGSDFSIYNIEPFVGGVAPSIAKRHRYRPRIPNYRIAGWQVRSDASPKRKFAVVLSKDGKIVDDPAAFRDRISLRIRFRIVGQKHERREAITTAIEIDE
ncbi:hypothetical protein GGQ99_001316 [Aminobacter niigataensis]|uniref:von Hippel-Lindau disease tumour suppressor beta domain-containing protein n=1 Tax=Aminobacter niigataensis TaxID=83265 RepID=A0ABR6KYI4_9HYPH|nr:hypothetical protein [Aminobacter niigataensis]MBB4649594.1 hypothetical protein [Aminobacter niigataensis]